MKTAILAVPPSMQMLQTHSGMAMDDIYTGLICFISAVDQCDDEKTQAIMRASLSVLINGILLCSQVKFEDFNEKMVAERERLDLVMAKLDLGDTAKEVMDKLAESACEWLETKSEDEKTTAIQMPVAEGIYAETKALGDDETTEDWEDDEPEGISVEADGNISVKQFGASNVAMNIKTDKPENVLYMIAAILKTGASVIVKQPDAEKFFQEKEPLAASIDSCGNNILNYLVQIGINKAEVEANFVKAGMAMGGALKKHKLALTPEYLDD